MKKINNTNNILLALFAGTVAGGLLGMLCSRGIQQKRYSKLIENSKDLADDIKQKMEHQIIALRSKAEVIENVIRDKERMEIITNNIKQKLALTNKS